MYMHLIMNSDQSYSDYSDLENCACAKLRRATRIISQAYDAALRPAGLRTTQFNMLAILANRGQIRQTEFADTLGMDGTTLTRNLRPLHKKEWIQIERGEDLRVRLISLTSQGRDVLNQAVPLWREVQSRFVGGSDGKHWAGLLTSVTEAIHRP